MRKTAVSEQAETRHVNWDLPLSIRVRRKFTTEIIDPCNSSQISTLDRSRKTDAEVIKKIKENYGQEGNVNSTVVWHSWCFLLLVSYRVCLMFTCTYQSYILSSPTVLKPYTPVIILITWVSSYSKSFISRVVMLYCTV